MFTLTDKEQHPTQSPWLQQSPQLHHNCGIQLVMKLLFFFIQWTKQSSLVFCFTWMQISAQYLEWQCSETILWDAGVMLFIKNYAVYYMLKICHLYFIVNSQDFMCIRLCCFLLFSTLLTVQPEDQNIFKKHALLYRKGFLFVFSVRY